MRIRKIGFIILLILASSTAPLRAARAAGSSERNFYDVLEDVLGDFDFDLKNGNVTGLKDIAIRNISVSESVPSSFKNHLDLLVTERILKNTKAKVLQCIACKSRRTIMNGDQMILTSTETNPTELARIAKQNGIEHFLDVAFTYQSSGLIISMYITEPESGSIVWTHSYNSETSRAAAFRRGADFSQMDEARRANEYTPTLQYHGAVGYFFEPNLSGITGCVAFIGRMMERYDNRKKEVGFEVNYLKDSSTLVSGNSPTASADATNNIYSGFNVTLLFTHAWNFIGEEENFNKVRGGLLLGVGGTYTSGYLGGLFRATYEWRMGKHFSVSTILGYRPSSTAFIGTSADAGKSVSGPELGAGINLLF